MYYAHIFIHMIHIMKLASKLKVTDLDLNFNIYTDTESTMTTKKHQQIIVTITANYL